MAEAPTCLFCGRPSYDPDKRERPWARAVRGGRQILVCPRCQVERPDWLSAMLGEIVCRACGHAWPSAAEA
jgi:hypothetical protein